MSRAVPRFKRINALLPALATPAYRVTQFFLCDNQICIVTCDYIALAAGQTASSEQNIATSFFNATNVAFKNVLAADCRFQSTKVQCLTIPARQPYILSGDNAGNVAGNHVPLEMAVILSKQTGTKGQHGRGRLYVPGVPTSFVAPATDANRLTLAAAVTYASLASALQSNTIVDGAIQLTCAVTQRTTKGAATTNGAATTLIAARTLLGTVRRRRIGRGK